MSCREPNNCDFEDDSFCGWDNVKNIDQFDWEITSGPSSSTLLSGKNRSIYKKMFSSSAFSIGPLFDHTLGTADGSYAFIDTNQIRKLNDTALLISQSMADTGLGGKCLEFFYHM